MTGLDYAIVGFLVLIFIFELIMIWIFYYGYTQLNNNYNDLNDMTIDIYNLAVIEAKTAGREAVLQIPKHSREIYLSRHKQDA